MVKFSGNSVCLHWKLWQIFKQPGLRIHADILEIKIEEQTTVGSYAACSSQTGNEGTNNLKCVVTVEEPNICFVSVETKTKNPQQELDECTRCDNIKKLKDEENEQPCPGTVFGKSIRDFEQEINGVTSVEEEMLDTLSESYSSENAIAQDNKTTATSDDNSDSIQETPEIEDILKQEIGDKLVSHTKFTENYVTTNEIHNEIQPANDDEHVATEDTFGIFNETNRCNENVLEVATTVGTDEVCDGHEENVGTLKERVGMGNNFGRVEISKSLQERLSTNHAVVAEYNQGSEQGTKTDGDKKVVESQEVIRDKELNFIKEQDITVYETSENSPNLERNSDCEPDSEYIIAVNPAASSGVPKELDVNYDRYNDCSRSIDTNSHIFPTIVQAGDNVKNIVCQVPDECSRKSDTLNCHNDNTKYGQSEKEDTSNINDCSLEDVVPGTSIGYEYDTQRTIPENLSNQVTGMQVIEEVKENALAFENPRNQIKIFRCNHILFNTQTNCIPESQLDQVIGDHVIEDIEQNVPMSPSSAIPKQNTQINHIPESHLDQVIGDHVIEDIEQNVPLPSSRAMPKQDTQINYIPEFQLDHVIGDYVIEDIEQNVPMSPNSAKPKQDTQMNYIPESHLDQVIGDHVIEDIEQNVPMPPSNAIPKQDTQINYILESHLDQGIGDHIIEDSEQNVPMSGHVISNNSAVTAVSEHETERNISESQSNPVIAAHAIEDIEQNIAYRFYGCFTPYGAKCRPNIYGFRGPLHVWNEEEGKYTLVYNDRVTVVNCRARQIPLTEGNIHQAYIPKSFCKH